MVRVGVVVHCLSACSTRHSPLFSSAVHRVIVQIGLAFRYLNLRVKYGIIPDIVR